MWVSLITVTHPTHGLIRKMYVSSGCAMRKEPCGWWGCIFARPALYVYDETLITTREALQSPLQQRAARQPALYRRWRRGSFTWLRVGDNPYVATPEREVGDLLHLPPAEGRQPHSIKLEVFALKLNRRARRVCLALGHPRNKSPAQGQENAHSHANSLVIRGNDDEDGGDGDGGGDVLKRRCHLLSDDGARSGAAWQADRLTSSQSCGREVM